MGIAVGSAWSCMGKGFRYHIQQSDMSPEDAEVYEILTMGLSFQEKEVGIWSETNNPKESYSSASVSVS